MHRIRSWAKAQASNRNPSAHISAKGPHSQRRASKEQSPPNTSVATPSRPGHSTGNGDNVENEGSGVKQGLLVQLKNGSLRFLKHTKDAVCYSRVNILLVFVPVGIVVKAVHLSPGLIFAMNALAIVPLAGLLSHATESVASRLGDTVGALLNVTFGNAVELIIFVALVKNEIRIVQASLLGSILANLLLILGMAFLLGGLRFREQIYNSTVTQMSACLLSLSVMSLLLPTAFHASWANSDAADKYTLKISRGTSVVLLLIYVLYILFQLKSHAYLYASIPQRIIDEESRPGVLADVLRPSSPSSSSSASDVSESDSDTSSKSQTAAHHIKKAFKRRRRRNSSVSSKATTSGPSALASSITEPPQPIKADDDIITTFSHTQSRPRKETMLGAIKTGDKAGYDADNHHQDADEPRVRNLVQEQSISSDAPERPKGKKKRRAEEHSKAGHRLEGPQSASVAESALVSYPKAAEETPAQNATNKKIPFNFRPAMPRLLSNTVFSTPQPFTSELGPGRAKVTRNSRGIRRTVSLPDDLNQAFHVKNIIQFPPTSARIPQATISPEMLNETGHEPEMPRTTAVVMLLLSTGLVALCAEFLVDSIPAMIESSAVSQAFIGLIILPIIGNAAEHVTAVTVAAKNKMDLAIGVAVGSSIQIAIFVTPLIVILGWCLNKEMTLYFTLFETISLFVTAFVVNFLVLDGRSNYLEGALLIAAYVIIAVAAFYYPNGNDATTFGGNSGA